MSDSYSGALPVPGPLAPPARTHLPGAARCGCNPTLGQSCEGCDGTRAERYWRPAEDRNHELPPCMRRDRSAA